MPKYKDIETIPAKVFFKILNTKDYQLLKPKPKEKDLHLVFTGIYDDYFTKIDNTEAKRFLELQNERNYLTHRINMLRAPLAMYCFGNFEISERTLKMRKDFIEALKVGYNIIIDENVPFIQEVKRVLTEEIGIMQNDLVFIDTELKDFQKQFSSDEVEKEISFYKELAGLSNNLPNNALLKEEMSLAVFIELKNLQKELYEKSKKKPLNT